MSEGCFEPYRGRFGDSGTHFWHLGLTFGFLELIFAVPGLTFGSLERSLGFLGLTLRVSWEHLGASGPHFGALFEYMSALLRIYVRVSLQKAVGVQQAIRSNPRLSFFYGAVAQLGSFHAFAVRD